ncbi:MAG TPA: hypothetical protein VM915_00980, partial [Verrucomicrobiae bacterium]|nr:hypothetical protein [Verrucomicrobiae bacterium]
GQATRIYRRYGHYASDRVTPSTNPTLFFLALGAALFFALSHLIAAWKRRGEPAPAELWARRVSWVALAGALAVVVTIGFFVFMLIDLQNAGRDIVLSLPTRPMLWFLSSVLALGGFTLLALLGLYPALFRGRMTIWRKTHFVLLAAAMSTLMWAFFVWNAVGFRV